jgi:hypothetical protein
MDQPEIFGLARPKRLADFGFGDAVIASFAFSKDDRTVVVSFQAMTETILERVERFLRGLPPDALEQTAPAVAELFIVHEIASHDLSPDDVMLGDAWSSSALVRVTVDVNRATAAGIPIVTAVGATLINPDGETWTEDQPREDAQLVWAPVY